MTINEIRELYGLSPLDEGGDIRLQSLNYINANLADKYQVKGDKNEDERISK